MFTLSRHKAAFIAAAFASALSMTFAEDTASPEPVPPAAVLPTEAAQSEPELSFVVTASRTGEKAEDATSLVTTVTSDEIAASGASSAVEILENTLGITFRSASGDAEAQVSMRGFGENSFGRVLVLVDGKRLNNLDMATMNWLSIPVANIERIEVLHGSASVLYGAGAVGGVINIITKQPEEGLKTGIALSTGSNWDNGQSFDLSSGNSRGGIVSTVSRTSDKADRKRTENETILGTIAATRELTDTLSVKLDGGYSDIDYQMPGSLTKAQYEKDPDQAVNKADEGTMQTFDVGFTLDWLPTEKFSVTLPLAYRYGARSSDMASWTSWTDTFEHRAETHPQASWEGRLAGKDVRAVGGVDFHYLNLSVDVYGSSDRTTTTNDFTITQWELGPFASLRAQLLEKIALEIGLRYDTSSIAGESKTSSGDGDKLRSALVYSAGLNWEALTSVNLFTRWATTFRYPFTDEQTSYYYAPYSFNTDLKPEQGRDLEIGGNWRIGKKATIQAQGYWLEMEDEIAYNYTTYKNDNLDRTRRLGVDAGLNFKPIHFLDLSANYSWVRATFASGDNEGNRVPLVSEHSANFEARVNLPIHVSFGPTVSFRGEQYQGGDTSNTMDKLEACTLLGLLANFTPHLAKGELSLTAKVENLLDTTYPAYIYYDAYYPGEGRSFSLTLRYRH